MAIYYNGTKFLSENGLEDLLNENITDEILYPIVHLRADDIEIAFTHVNQSRDDYYSFVNVAPRRAAPIRQPSRRPSHGR